MNFFAPLEVQKELYLKLRDDVALATLLNAYTPPTPPDTVGVIEDKIFDFVPDNQAFPYITIYALPFTPRDNRTYDGLQCEFQISVWLQPGLTPNTGAGNRSVMLIQQRVDQLLHNQPLCVDGWNVLQMRRALIDIRVEDDNVTRQGIQRFKLFIGEK